MLLREPTRLYRRRQVHDLGELMAIYECNYIRLRQLLPQLASPMRIGGQMGGQMGGQTDISRAEGALDLHVRIDERNRYTTTLTLTYEFADEEGRFSAPDIQVRIYHDARLAEVLRCGRLRGQRDATYDSGRRDYTLDAKWRINRFLQKWLGYCLRQGHRFHTARPDDYTPAGEWPVVLANLNKPTCD